MEHDGICWTIIAGVLLKHEECPSWRNMQQIWLLLHVMAHWAFIQQTLDIFIRYLLKFHLACLEHI